MRRTPVLPCLLLAALALPAPAAASAYRDAVAATEGLRAALPLDERDGATLADLAGAVTGSWSGTPELGRRSALADDHGTSVTLDGDDGAALTGMPDLGGSLTVEAWVRPAPPAPGVRVIAGRGSTATGYHLQLDSAGRLALRVGTGSASTTVTGPAPSPDVWHHVAATVDGARAALVLDGREVATGTLPGPPAPTSLPLAVGRASRGDRDRFRGGLDELALYDRALPVAELAAHHAAGIDPSPVRTTLPGGPPELVGGPELTLPYAIAKPRQLVGCRLDGGAWWPCPSPVQLTGLTEGAHVLELRGVDAWGLLEDAPVVVPFRVDLTPPETVAIAAGGLAAMASEPRARFECATADGPWGPCASPVAVAPGTRALAVRAVDPAGLRDLTPAVLDPGVELPAGPRALVGATLRVAAAGGAGRLRCRLDGGEWQRCADLEVLRGLAPGAHVLGVRDGALEATLPLGVGDAAPRLAGLRFPAVLAPTRRAGVRARPKLIFAASTAGEASIEVARVRRGRRAVLGQWRAPLAAGLNRLAVPAAVLARLRAGRHEVVVRPWGAAGAGAPSLARFAVVRSR